MSLIFNNYDYHFWAAIQRIFITADPVLETHYTVENPIVETGDFSHTFEFVWDGGTSRVLEGSDVANYLRINSASLVRLQTPASTIDISLSTPILAGLFTKLKISRVGNAVSVFSVVNDIDSLLGVSSGALGTFTVDRFGQAGGSSFFDGIIANPDLGNGNAWKLDRPFPTTTEQAANGNNILTYVNAPDSIRGLFTFINGRWVGVGLWTFGDYTYTGSETPFLLLIGTNSSLDIIDGQRYQWSWTQIVVGTASSRLRVGGIVSNESASGDFSDDVVASGDDLYLQSGSDSSGSAGTTLTNVIVERFIEIA